MKAKLILGLGMLLSLPVNAQQEECYEPSRKAGIEYLKNKEFVEAKNIFENLHYCPDKPQSNDIQTFIDRCNEGLDPRNRIKSEAYSNRLSLYEQHFFGYHEGLMAVHKKEDLERCSNSYNDGINIDYDNAAKVGFIDENANLVIPCIYENSDLYSMAMGYFFSEGLAAVIKRHPNGPLSTDKSGRVRYGWGFIDKKGNEVIPFNLYAAQNFSEGIASVQVEYNGGWCFIDKSGKRINDETYYWTNSFQDGMCAVQPSKDNKGWGFINKSGKLVIPAIYKNVYPFENGVCAVSTEESGYETALLNKEGIMVGDYTFRPEYLRLKDMDIYAVDMYNQKKYDKCLMAILAMERRMAEENKPLDERNEYMQEPYMKGMIYYKGWGNLPEDTKKKKAFESFKLAKESNSMFMLAICYYEGHGTSPDYGLCRHYLEEAIRDNSWNSHGYHIYNTLTGETEGETGKIKEHPTQAEAQYILGQLYYWGTGGPVDKELGKKHIRQSADAGHEDAKHWLIEYD